LQKFERWFDARGLRTEDFTRKQRALLADAYAAGAASERIERVRDRQQEMCMVVSQSGFLGELIGCGFKLGHEGAHSWASLPTFLQAPVAEQEPPE
jgi:hypothetical protein